MPRRVRRGFALLEAVVALLVIGLAAAAALDLFSTQLRAARRQPGLVTAAALAQDRMAMLRLASPDELRRLPDSLARGEFPAPFAGYHWSAAATRARDESFYDLRVEVVSSEGQFTLASAASVPLARGVAR
jgi:prepilin-type N-terminal cleavage/methylation domain-containing protein